MAFKALYIAVFDVLLQKYNLFAKISQIIQMALNQRYQWPLIRI